MRKTGELALSGYVARRLGGNAGQSQAVAGQKACSVGGFGGSLPKTDQRWSAAMTTPPPIPDAGLLSRLLDVVEGDIMPLTRAGVAQGNKLFGAALLRKDDLSLVLAETNNEMENPLWHGEMHCLKRFYEMPAEGRPDTSELIFLSTHEPCSLCLSAITWAGFDNFFYLFSHEDSRDSFAIPHDLNILREVFTLPPGGYNATNAYWSSFSIRREAATLPAPEAKALQDRIDAIDAGYAEMSAIYQDGKSGNAIPLA
jgi:tRNA(Arg) A34 adenosine deaminase TadA